MVLLHFYTDSDHGRILKKAGLVITITQFSEKPDMDDINLINVCGLAASIDNCFSCIKPNKSFPVALICSVGKGKI